MVQEFRSRKEVWRREVKGIAGGALFAKLFSPTRATFSPEGRFVGIHVSEDGKNKLIVHDLAAGKEAYSLEDATAIEFSGDGAYAVVTLERAALVLRTSDWKEAQRIKRKNPSNQIFGGGAIPSLDGKWLAVMDSDALSVWDIATGKLVREHTIKRGLDTSSFVFAPGKPVVTFTAYRALWHWNFVTDEARESTMSSDYWGNLSYSPDGRLLALGSAENRVRLFDVEHEIQVGSLVVPNRSDWLVVTPAGQLDTSRLEDVQEVHWIVAPEPFVAQPLELYSHDFFQPRLLSRLVAGEKFSPPPDLARRNRALPEVEITAVTPAGPDMVKVSVRVHEVTSKTQRDAAGNPTRSGAAWVHVFRDGRLVARSSREFQPLTLDAQGTWTASYDVRVPRRDSASRIEFSAYAFNAGRVKSETARLPFEATASTAPVKGRAYIITVGVNASDDPSFALRYAVNDAQITDTELSARLVRTGRFAEIVEIPLLSDGPSEKEAKGTRNATKAAIKGTFDLLAGRSKDVSAEVRAQIPNAEKIRPALPEDLVLISLAGHGYADVNGVFYFVPSDIGQNVTELTKALARCISSTELSDWLSDIDAAEMLMIVDACHSAAIVEGKDFKPGPFGSQGLGQLAYDKGIRVLVATQAADAALEFDRLEHGVLTYALIADGLIKGRADNHPVDKAITTREWLEFAVDRVPELVEEARNGVVRSLENGKPVQGERAAVAIDGGGPARSQRPSLFDFARSGQEAVLGQIE